MSCEEWLYGFITNLGFCEVSRARKAAKEKGFSKSEFKQARKNIGAKTWTTFNEGVQVWYWYIPTERAKK